MKQFTTHSGDIYNITNDTISVDDYENMDTYKYILLETNYYDKEYKSIFASPSTQVSYSNWAPNSQKDYITLRQRLLNLDYDNNTIDSMQLRICVESI